MRSVTVERRTRVERRSFCSIVPFYFEKYRDTVAVIDAGKPTSTTNGEFSDSSSMKDTSAEKIKERREYKSRNKKERRSRI